MKMIIPVAKNLLIAVNELDYGDADLAMVRSWFVDDPEKKIFLDSGVYNFATQYALTHDLSMDQALSFAPSEMEGFENLFTRYVSIVHALDECLWGYIEIDQGGRENKIKTRARLEALGLHPIPVYHPLNDGWDYFDYLAERYDRICFGNIVNAKDATRKRLIATAWERHRKYPHLWIHVLGLQLHSWLYSLPLNSCDTSSWLHPVRWPRYPSRCMGAVNGLMGPEYRYVLTKDGATSDDLGGSKHAVAVCGYTHHLDGLTWQGYVSELARMGFATYPPPLKGLEATNVKN